MGRLTEILLDLLFPRRCPFCGTISEGICDKCRRKAAFIEHPFCYRCGKPLAAADRELCGDCLSHRHFFRQGRALLVYDEMARRAVYSVKYRNKREYLEYFAQEMANRFQRELSIWKPQAVIPIPMHKKARRIRGYNQAEILAGYFGRETRLPVYTNVLRKIRRTANQKELNRRQRRSNLRGAFDIDSRYLNEKGCLPWKRVLLADDVFTTGSTLDEAARVLRTYGVEEVYFVTICIVTE